MNAPDLRKRFRIGFGLWVIIIAAVTLFVAVPFPAGSVAQWIIDVQAQARAGAELLAPLLMVAGLGAAVGLAELSSTFSDYPREAIATQWGQYTLWLNAGAAVLAYLVARIYAPASTNSIILIIAVGTGFPTLIRTKYTIAKQFGGDGKDDLTVNIGWLYEQFQSLCKKQIDLELMAYRRMQVDRLLGRYSTVQELYQTAVYAIKARATLSDDEERRQLEDLLKTIDPKVSPELARTDLGLKILELGGVSLIELLVGARGGGAGPAAPTPPSGAAAPAAAPTAAAPPPEAPAADAVVKKLAELPVAELVAMSKSLLKAQEDLDFVEKSSQPTPGLSELRQKAPIAYYLVAHVGADAVTKELAKRQPTP